MLRIDPHIRELLSAYDCVVVPDLGGFVANPIPARIDKEQHLFIPPGRAVVFNQNLTNNDGLLANKVALEQSVDYQEALTVIREYVLYCKTTLQEQGRFELDELGILYFDQEKNLCFQPKDELLLLPDAFGLSSFFAKPITNEAKVAKKVIPLVKEPVEETVEVEEEKVIPVREKVVSRSTKERKDRPPVKQVRETTTKSEANELPNDVVVIDQRKKRRWPIMVAAGACLLSAFYYYHIPKNTDYRYSGRFEMAQLVQFGDQVDPTIYEPRTAVFECDPLLDSDPLADFTAAGEAETLELRLTEEAINPIIVRLKDKIPVRRDNTDVELTPDERLSQRYQVIGGCFANKNNADRLVENLKADGYDAVIFDQHKGLYRVSMGGYGSRKEARAELRRIRGLGISAWVLKH